MNIPTSYEWELLRDMPMTPVMINGVDMFCLLGMLQLALRHPGAQGIGPKVALVFAQELEKRIVEASPGFKDLCAAGWDAKYDVPA